MPVTAATAKLYRDARAADELVSLDQLTRADLCIGFLVTDGDFVLRHEEHDPIRIPRGRYYVGRQLESTGAEERIVTD